MGSRERVIQGNRQKPWLSEYPDGQGFCTFLLLSETLSGNCRLNVSVGQCGAAVICRSYGGQLARPGRSDPKLADKRIISRRTQAWSCSGERPAWFF
jgi:hypothetical protein